MAILVKYNFDYADEFDVYGIVLFDTQEEFDRSLNETREEIESVTSKGGQWKRYFGTNEAILINSFDEYMEGLTIQEITEEEAEVVRRLIGEGFGNPI